MNKDGGVKGVRRNRIGRIEKWSTVTSWEAGELGGPE